MRAIVTLVLAGIISALTGCANISMTPSFERSEAYSAQGAQHGVVVQVREVQIAAPSSATWQAAGLSAPVSLLASQLFRHDSWTTQAAVAAGISLGAAVIGNSAGKSRGVQAVVKMDSGNIVSVVQPLEQGNPIVPGQRVLLVGNGRLIASSF